jgi:hypothetical protein
MMTDLEFSDLTLEIMELPEMKMQRRVLKATEEIIMAYRENGLGDPPKDILKAMERLEDPAQPYMDKLLSMIPTS